MRQKKLLCSWLLAEPAVRFSWGTKRKRDWEWSSWLPNWHSWVIWFNDLLSLSDFFYFARRLESFGCARKAKGAVRGICAKDLFFFVAESSFFLFLSLFLLSSVSQVPQPTWRVNCLMVSPPGCSLKSPLMMVMMLQRSRKSKMRKNEEEVKMCDLKIRVH